MKTKLVNRYYCDFCNKSGCNAGWINKHERGCTKNPNRECGVCKFMQVEQVPLATLIAMLPCTASWSREEWESDRLTVELNAAVKSIRSVANECPACIMAAVRQGGFDMGDLLQFDFKSEMKTIFETAHEQELSRQHHG